MQLMATQNGAKISHAPYLRAIHGYPRSGLWST